MTLKPTIGLEIHVELKTKSKMFCSCSAEHFAKKPNTQTCPVCLGLPGALPVPNKQAIDWTIMLGLALDCQINLNSTFDRKHYFYPDLPKGFQISQYDDPFCFEGKLALASGKTVRITRVHLEEDTGKLQHQTINGEEVSLVDFNRSGVPLVEIVTEPDITSGAEAKEFLKKLRDIIRSLGISDCDMEKGSMRLEPNISWSESVKKLSSYKVEIKNLNSFRFTLSGIDYELKRQKEILDSGKIPLQETRGYNSAKKETVSQRGKETAADYRYFPEPDIAPIVLTQDYIDSLKAKLPQLPEATADKLVEKHGLKSESAKLLSKNLHWLEYFNQNLSELEPQALANLIINKKVDLTKALKGQLKQPAGEIDEAVIDKVLAANKEAVAKFKAGKTQVIGFLVGAVMKEVGGKADPAKVSAILRDKMS